MAEGWYFKDGSVPAETETSTPPTYPTQLTQNSNTRL